MSHEFRYLLDPPHEGVTIILIAGGVGALVIARLVM